MDKNNGTRLVAILYLATVICLLYVKISLISAQEEPRHVENDEASPSVAANKPDALQGGYGTPELRQLGDPLRPRLHRNNRRVRQEIYNFYNIRPSIPIRDANYNNYDWPRPRPRPRPSNNIQFDDDYDDGQYYQRPPPQPYPFMPYQAPPFTSTTTTTTAPAPEPTRDPTSPIGYMLIDTYHTPAGSNSRPIAFFGT